MRYAKKQYSCCSALITDNKSAVDQQKHADHTVYFLGSYALGHTLRFECVTHACWPLALGCVPLLANSVTPVPSLAHCLPL